MSRNKSGSLFEFGNDSHFYFLEFLLLDLVDFWVDFLSDFSALTSTAEVAAEAFLAAICFSRGDFLLRRVRSSLGLGVKSGKSVRSWLTSL